MQFPPITQPMAIEIAQRACNVQKRKFNCYANKPDCINYKNALMCSLCLYIFTEENKPPHSFNFVHFSHSSRYSFFQSLMDFRYGNLHLLGA